MADKKKSLDLLLAVGKSGPKPEPGMDEMAEEPAPDLAMAEPVPPAEPMESENCITLPPGFKAPDGSEDGKPFTTTVRGKIMDGKFYPESIGDMPLDGVAAPAEEPMPEEGSYAMKKADENAAKSAFQS